MKTIPLSNSNEVAIVDDQDYKMLMAYNWHRLPRTGAYCRIRGETVSMASVILNCRTSSEYMIDHASGDSLDNRRANLRPCTNSQNLGNRRKQRLYAGKPTSSRYKGVSWHKQFGKWHALICCEGTVYSLGVYDDEEKAARAYDRKARELFREFARTNF